MFTAKYRKYLKSDAWKAKREEAFRLHGKRCKECGATRQLEVNHKHYRNIFNENVKEDLEILCHVCHCIYHGASPEKMRLSVNRKVLSRRQKRLVKKRRMNSYEPMAMTMDEWRARNNGYSTNARQKPQS